MTLDGVKQNEYVYQNNGNVNTNSSNAATESSAPNSVYEVKENENNTEQAENKKSNDSGRSNLEKQFERLERKLKKFNISIEDIKNNNLIFNISGLTEEELEDLPERKLNNVFDAIETAIKDSITDNKVDWEKAGTLGKDYLVALATGWTIEGFKRHNNTIKKSSLLERLKETGCLPKDATIENTSMEELKNAVDKFCHMLLGDLKENPTRREVKMQLQTFGRLLINSPQEEKELFLEVIKSLYAENRANGLDALMMSCKNRKHRQEIAKKASDPDYIKEITTAPIKDENGKIINNQEVSQDDATEIAAIINKNLSEDDITESHENYDNARKEWYEKNKEILSAIEQKIKEANEKGIEPEFTDEEKQILLEQRNFIVGVSSGEFIGTIENKDLSDEFKNKHLNLLNTDSYELPSYKEIIKQINNYVENCPDSISLPKEEYKNILDKSTNGNYTKITTGNDSELNPPKTYSQNDTEAETPDYGFAQKDSIDTTKLLNLRLQIRNNTEKEGDFKVESSITPTIEPTNMNEKFANANTRQEKIAIVKELFDNSPLLKKALEKYLSGMTNCLNVLNALPSNARKYLAQRLTQKGVLNENDIQKLNLSFNEKQLLHNIIKENEKNQKNQ